MKTKYSTATGHGGFIFILKFSVKTAAMGLLDWGKNPLQHLSFFNDLFLKKGLFIRLIFQVQECL